MRRDEELEVAWRRGTRADIERPRPTTSVLSIRVPSSLLERLSERARAEGKPISYLAREVIELALASDAPSTPEDLAELFAHWLRDAQHHLRKKQPPKAARRASTERASS